MHVHDEVLGAAIRICGERGGWTFTPDEIVRALPHQNPSTVRTHVVSRCCTNAPKNHPHKWDYFRRTSRGHYEIAPRYRPSAGRRRAGRNPRDAGDEPLRDTVHAVVSRSGNAYVVDCLELAVVTQGHTLDEAMANLREAVDLHLEGEDPRETGMIARPRLSVTYETAIGR